MPVPAPKILMLCHGGRWVLTSDCPTMGVPITPDAISAMTFVDAQARSHPHVVADWKKPTRLARHKFDVVTTACCSYDTFIDPDNGTLCSVAFRNVVRVLKPGGFFVFTTAFRGVKAFASHIQYKIPDSAHLTQKTESKVLHRLALEIQAQHPELRLVSHTSAAVQRWTRSLARHFEMTHSLRDDLLVFRHV